MSRIITAIATLSDLIVNKTVIRLGWFSDLICHLNLLKICLCDKDIFKIPCALIVHSPTRQFCEWPLKKIDQKKPDSSMDQIVRPRPSLFIGHVKLQQNWMKWRFIANVVDKGLNIILVSHTFLMVDGQFVTFLAVLGNCLHTSYVQNT